MTSVKRIAWFLVLALVFATPPTFAQKGGSRPTFSSSRTSRPSTPSARPSSRPTPSIPASPRSTYTPPSSKRTSPTFSTSGRSKSPTFSSSGTTANPVAVPAASKPSFDNAAARAQAQQRSATKFSDWKRSQGIDVKPFDPNLSATRTQRQERAYSNRQPNTYIVRTPVTTVHHYYHDPYDDRFLQYASTMWLLNHWDNIDHSRFDSARIAELETQVAQLKARGQYNPNYTDPGVDPDLMFSKDSGVYDSGSSVGKVFVWTLGVLAFVGLAGFCIWYVFVRQI